MTVLHVDPTTDPRWASLVEERRGSLFQAPPWLAAIRTTYGFDISAVIVLDAHGEPRSGVPYAKVDDDLGARIVSLPFTDAVDPLLGSDTDLDVLAAAVQSFGLPWSLRCLNVDTALLGSSFALTRGASWHRLDLGPSPDAAWRAASGGFRRGVRKAHTEGVEVHPLGVGGQDDVDRFAALHRDLRRTKFGMLSQPVSFFAALREQLAPHYAWHPLGAFRDGELLAATVYLRWGDTLFYKFNASRPDTLGVRPNNALVWAGIELAGQLGCATLDLGPSDDDQPGLVRFKAQTGATGTRLRVQTWSPPGRHSAASADRLRRTLAELTTLVVAPGVDDAVVAAAGDALYRWFA